MPLSPMAYTSQVPPVTCEETSVRMQGFRRIGVFGLGVRGSGV